MMGSENKRKCYRCNHVYSVTSGTHIVTYEPDTSCLNVIDVTLELTGIKNESKEKYREETYPSVRPGNRLASGLDIPIPGCTD